MREILFKAKRIDNGEWVEGFYFCMVHDDGRHVHHFIMPLGTDLNLGTPIEKIQVEVDINTICQYTGLTDKNGNKIWENDIISYPQIYARGNVAFVEDTFVLFDDWDGKQYINGMWKKFEVIGNIFDNAELVKE